MVLKHHGTFRTWLGHLMLVENDPTIGGLKQARHDIEHGRFTASRVTDQRDEFAGLNFQIHIFQRFELAFWRIEFHADIGEFQ